MELLSAGEISNIMQSLPSVQNKVLLEILLAQCSLEDDNAWIWHGATITQGKSTWGYVSYLGKTISAHRAAWIAVYGDPGPKRPVRRMAGFSHLDINPSHMYIPEKKAPKSSNTVNPLADAPALIQTFSSFQTPQVSNNVAYYLSGADSEVV